MNAQPIGEQEVDGSVTKHLICDVAFADANVVGPWCIHTVVHSISQMCIERSASPFELAATERPTSCRLAAGELEHAAAGPQVRTSWRPGTLSDRISSSTKGLQGTRISRFAGPKTR